MLSEFPDILNPSQVARYYHWVKAFHVISVIAWMAGLLYLPRLFVYHAGIERDSDTAKLFSKMEFRLFYLIMTPAMIASYAFGIALVAAWGVDIIGHSWLHWKLLLVVLLTIFHLWLGGCQRALSRGRSRHSQGFYRLANEIPALIMIGIVVLAVVKPLL